MAGGMAESAATLELKKENIKSAEGRANMAGSFFHEVILDRVVSQFRVVTQFHFLQQT